ncbi:MAG: hypothetical protein ACREML_02695 [Vulcanimicrobiaceae bacterium]
MAVAFAVVVLLASHAASAADTRVSLTLDGRPISTRPAVALVRNGVLFVDAVDVTRVFDGLLVFERHGVRLGVRGHNLSFTIGKRIAQVDKSGVRLKGAPFEFDGDIFVPVEPIVNADPALHLTWVNRRHADLHVNAF